MDELPEARWGINGRLRYLQRLIYKSCTLEENKMNGAVREASERRKYFCSVA